MLYPPVTLQWFSIQILVILNETLNVEVEGKQTSLFTLGPAIKCFVIPPASKIEKKNCEKLFGSQICCGFKEHDLIMSKVQVVVFLGS